MADSRNIVRVKILGKEYRIRKGNKSVAYYEKLARRVDERMQQVSSGTTLISTGDIAVLAALNLAEEIHRLEAGQKKREEYLVKRIESLLQRLQNIM